MLLRPNPQRLCASSASRIRLSPVRQMPLRARILDPAVAGARSIVTATNSIGPEKGDTPNDVVFNTTYGVRTIELNRPQKLNSLDGSMCRKIIPRLLEWQKSDMVNAIIMKGAGEKSLCAGGDVASLAKLNEQGPAGQQQSKDYFALEYKLDHLIATQSKPYIALMDGATMGGGVGLSVHAPFRIATERTQLAMPETRIGFFPDVGASFFLSRLDGALGRYLALTSETLRGVQTFYHGFATHYLHSSSLPDLEARLAELTIPDYASWNDRLHVINDTIAEFTTGLPHDQPIQLSGELRKAIDYCFASYNVKSVLHRLQHTASHEQSSQEIREWAQKTLSTMSERSPTSMKVTLRMLAIGKQWDIAEAFRREHLIASRFMEHPDFVEGVSARLIRKSKGVPDWKPASLDEVTDKDVDSFFRPQEGQLSLQFLTQGPGSSYKEYPHQWLALPTEHAIKDAVQQQSRSRDAILNNFLQSTKNKVGVKEKIQEVLDRMTKTEGGLVAWSRSTSAAQADSGSASSSDPDPDAVIS